MALLIEHYGGAFPSWLAPVQAAVIPVTDRSHEYATEVCEELRNEGFRVSLDLRSEKVGYKIREAQVKKVPYMLIVGDREVENRQVAVRHREQGDLGPGDIAEFILTLKKEVAEKII
jgi:threonyl-tRNA synthetase